MIDHWNVQGVTIYDLVTLGKTVMEVKQPKKFNKVSVKTFRRKW